MKKPDLCQERFRHALRDNGVTILLPGLVPSVRKAAPHVEVRLTPTLRGVMPQSTRDRPPREFSRPCVCAPLLVVRPLLGRRVG
jgi:hypothetical protein